MECRSSGPVQVDKSQEGSRSLVEGKQLQHIDVMACLLDFFGKAICALSNGEDRPLNCKIYFPNYCSNGFQVEFQITVGNGTLRKSLINPFPGLAY